MVYVVKVIIIVGIDYSWSTSGVLQWLSTLMVTGFEASITDREECKSQKGSTEALNYFCMVSYLIG